MSLHVTSQEMAAVLSISVKTLHRYRVYDDDRRFLKPGVHYFRQTLESRSFVWDVEKTARAYKAAIGKHTQATA